MDPISNTNTKVANDSFLGLLKSVYGPAFLLELDKARQHNSNFLSHDLVMPQVRENLNNDALLQKPVTVAKEGSFPVDGQAPFRADKQEQEQAKLNTIRNNVFQFRVDRAKEPAESPYAEKADGSTAFSYAPLDLLKELAGPGFEHPGVQVRAEDWAGVLSQLQQSQFKKSNKRFTAETFDNFLSSQKEVPWARRFEAEGDNAPYLRVLNIMRDGAGLAPFATPEQKQNLQRSKEFYYQLIQNLPGIVQNEHPTAKQLFS